MNAQPLAGNGMMQMDTSNNNTAASFHTNEADSGGLLYGANNGRNEGHDSVGIGASSVETAAPSSAAAAAALGMLAQQSVHRGSGDMNTGNGNGYNMDENNEQNDQNNQF